MGFFIGFWQAGGVQDTQLYQQILGLIEPWQVRRVTLKPLDGRIEVEVECTETVWACPTCGQRMHGHGHETRRWRHLDSCQFQTILVAEVPRLRCREHGTQQVPVPWAEKNSRFTQLFERLAIDVLQECSVSATCEWLRISWDEADGIKQRAVARGLARQQAAPAEAPRRLCVDEKSAGRGHDYVTVVAKVEEGKKAIVAYVGEGRQRESLDAYWLSLTAEQRAGVEAVGMDMWEPYRLSTQAHVPAATTKIVHDPFHLVRYVNEAVNDVRKEEQRVLATVGDERLKGSKQLWLYGHERVPASRAAEFEALKAKKLKTSRAWALKELFREMWACETLGEARTFFGKWYGWAMRSRLEPMKKVARMFRRHEGNILTYFVHRLTNAAIEGLNNRIAGLVKKAYGYRNRERFKTDILFHLGGLSLYPKVQ